jgi:hypothetical protein
MRALRLALGALLALAGLPYFLAVAEIVPGFALVLAVLFWALVVRSLLRRRRRSGPAGLYRESPDAAAPQ